MIRDHWGKEPLVPIHSDLIEWDAFRMHRIQFHVLSIVTVTDQIVEAAIAFRLALLNETKIIDSLRAGSYTNQRPYLKTFLERRFVRRVKGGSFLDSIHAGSRLDRESYPGP